MHVFQTKHQLRPEAMTTIYMHNTGPLIVYDGGMLRIEALNPEVKTKWRMSRSEVLHMGLRTMYAALTPSTKTPK